MNELKRIKGLERLYQGSQPWENRYPDLVLDNWGGPKGFLCNPSFEGSVELQAAESLYEAIHTHGVALGRPINVLETGSCDGLSTCFLARAVADAHGGHVWTCEYERRRSDDKRRPWPSLWLELHLASFISACVGDSRDIKTWTELIEAEDEWAAEVRKWFMPIPDQVDAIFLDSQHDLRTILAEWELIGPRLRPGGLLLLHDTSLFAEVDQALKLIARAIGVAPTPLLSCRGLSLLRLL